MVDYCITIAGADGFVHGYRYVHFGVVDGEAVCGAVVSAFSVCGNGAVGVASCFRGGSVVADVLDDGNVIIGSCL